MPGRRLCEYRDFFGQPEKGFHSVRLFNVAILDVLGTFVLAWLMTRFSFNRQALETSAIGKLGWWKRYAIILLFLLALGEFFHWFFCVPTNVQKWLTE